ncbi:hypothetical protein [Bacillus paralicheniformis]|uniref:hypothetical protein n=1 Tax=Bacillus paralicheniformis TaxID=1648923 RepID=UPI0030DC721D
MNEKQKQESGQVNPADKKSEKDYSKYFEAVYIPPSLKDAKKRGKESVQYHNDFKISEEFKGLGEGRKFYIRTYGCQMNEHDTEVMAGIFMALGYEAKRRRASSSDSFFLTTVFDILFPSLRIHQSTTFKKIHI